MTIVTAFYDIGRGDFGKAKNENKKLQRDSSKYFSNFAFWAGLKNKLIVFTSVEFKDEILKIRKEAGGGQTEVIVKELESFDSEALKKMRQVFANFDQTKGRKNPANLECVSAEYDYLMYCKPFFVCEAIQRGLCEEQILWLDFGYNHGGKFFANPSQFNFELFTQGKIEKQKINFFKLKDEEKEHLATIYFSMEVFLMGGCVYGDTKSWEIFAKDMKKALETFASLGLVDDDQPLFLWCVRNNAKNYHLNRVYDVFDGLYYFIPKERALKLEVVQRKLYKLIKNQLKEKFSLKLYFEKLYHKFITRKKVGYLHFDEIYGA